MKLDFSVDSRIAVSQCCELGIELDGASGPSTPAPGDMTLCCYCGSLNIFDADLSLRRPTDAEIFEAAASREIQVIRRAIEATNAKRAAAPKGEAQL